MSDSKWDLEICAQVTTPHDTFPDLHTHAHTHWHTQLCGWTDELFKFPEPCLLRTALTRMVDLHKCPKAESLQYVQVASLRVHPVAAASAAFLHLLLGAAVAVAATLTTTGFLFFAVQNLERVRDRQSPAAAPVVPVQNRKP